jgi:N-acetylmuramoyl-L-alanine amidase
MIYLLRRVAVIVAACAIALPAAALTAEICQDPGHGGSDPGAVGNGQQEKTNNLNTILKFNDHLYRDTNNTAGGGSWGRVLTRSSDVSVSLASRVAISNNNASNRFMSIHNNAFNGSANGTETFSYTSGSANSHNLRNHVQSRMLQAWGRVNRGNKTANFYVLKYTNAPAELAELAFIDHAGDAAYTGNATHQGTAARYHLYATQNHYGITAFNP